MDELLREVRKLQVIMEGIALELRAQQNRNFAGSDFLTHEFKSATEAVNNLARKIDAKPTRA
jgi:hypothetical protein